MAKVSQVNNGDLGQVARVSWNEAMKTVETDGTTLSGDGTTGSPLAVATLPSGSVVSVGTSGAGSNSVSTPSTPIYIHRKTAITGGGDTETLPDTSGLTTNQIFVVVDESGNAGTDNITIATFGAETISGQATAIINVNYGAYRFFWNGTNYILI